MSSIPIPRTQTPSADFVWQMVALCERLVSAVLLVAVSPILLGSALVVAVLSRRTPLIAHRRVGWNGGPLWMLKLRTMWDGERRGGWRLVEYIEDDAGPELKDADDARVTSSFAAFCRRHSIDELPQLWHVVRGEMALVGPRPVTSAELDKYYGADAQEILSVKPGIAGLWQISGRNRLSYRQRRELDLVSVRDRTLRQYGRILLRTVPEVVWGRNSW